MTEDAPNNPSTKGGDDRMQDWWRIAPMVFFALISYFVLWLLFIGALLQYISVATQGETADQIASFNRSVRQYLIDIFDYLTYKRDAMPFPFGDFPAATAEANEAAPPHPGPAPTAPASATVITPAPAATPKPAAEPAVTTTGVAKRAAAKSAKPKPKRTATRSKTATKPKSPEPDKA
jgi:cytoskeletal protein RodZ